MITGIVCSWNSSQGSGLVEGNNDEEYFLHISKERSGQVCVIIGE
jgi:cold shock CspA family protein